MKKFKILFIIICIYLMVPYQVFAEEPVGDDKQKKDIIVTLESCVDGDTAKFRMESGVTLKARLLAVDTPETVHPTVEKEPYGKEASEYTCDTLTKAKEIKIEYDENSDEEDKYGRSLVWVFTDGVLLQESLVRLGYAEVAYLYDNYKYTPLLQDAEVLAKNEKVGIWSEETPETEKDKEEEVKKTEKKETVKKGFIQSIVDNLFAKIFDFVDDLLDKIVKAIESML